MIDEEAVGQAEEVAGEAITTCDLCGRPVPRARLIPLAGRPGLSEPVEEILVCEECRIRIEQEEVPFDEEIAAGLQPAEE